MLLLIHCACARRTTLETRLAATRNEVASTEARADARGRHRGMQSHSIPILTHISYACARRTTLETRLTAIRNEVASMEARADPMAREPALQADIRRLQGEACAAVRPAPAISSLRCGPSGPFDVLEGLATRLSGSGGISCMQLSWTG